MRAVVFVASSALVLQAATASAVEASSASGGVLIVALEEGLAADRSGLKVGDRLLRWEQRPASARHNKLMSPVDLWLVEIEHASRAPVKLIGYRDAQHLSVRMAPGDWGLTTTPILGEPGGATNSDAPDQAALGVDDWQSLATASEEDEELAVASWLFYHASALAYDSGHLNQSRLLFESAIRTARHASEYSWAAELYRRRGNQFKSSNHFSEAGELYDRSRSSWLLLGRKSLGLALVLHDLGSLRSDQGDVAQAESLLREALGIRQDLAPQSLVVADSLQELGLLAWSTADIEESEQFHLRALLIRQELVPGRLPVASSLNNLGLVAARRGDVSSARAYYGEALAIQQAQAPQSAELAATLLNLGNLALKTDDFITADRHLHEALRIQERHSPESLSVAKSLGTLGIVSWRRGDLSAAEGYFRRSLPIWEKLAPRSLDMATTMENLGIIAVSRGDLDTGEVLHKRALAMREDLAPGSFLASFSLSNLGGIAYERGDFSSAENFFRRSSAIAEKIAPESLDLAVDLHALAEVLRRQGKLDSAERQAERALTIRNSLAPESAAEAETLLLLASILLDRKRPKEAVSRYLQALDALDAQLKRIGGTSENPGVFLSAYDRYYRDAVSLLLDQRRPAEAFHVSERLRARGLLSLLSQHDGVVVGVPEDLKKEGDSINAEHDRILHELAQWNASEPQGEHRRGELLEQLGGVRHRQNDWRIRLRTRRPELASLYAPQPLTVNRARGVLDEDTLLLSYIVHSDEITLFQLGPAWTLNAFVLPEGREALQARIEDFRRLWRPGGDSDEWIRARAGELGEILLSPVRSAIKDAKRIIIIPDGPINYLPFAALRNPGAEGFEYLVESKPISVVASLSVLAELQRRKARESPGVVVAFGDPSYAEGDAVARRSADDEIARSLDHGLRLDRLPFARQEVESLRDLYAGRSVIYLGADASEERAKALGSEASIVHFSTHGLMDGSFPMGSALALSMPKEWREDRENGLLQAWEILQDLRIDADLVTLSACETALGEVMGGEGIIGLTRAFQLAGARAVLASLWRVSDRSTSELMIRFYRNLKEGDRKDKALQKAQGELLLDSVGEYSHPFYWAGFQLVGDGR